MKGEGFLTGVLGWRPRLISFGDASENVEHLPFKRPNLVLTRETRQRSVNFRRTSGRGGQKWLLSGVRTSCHLDVEHLIVCMPICLSIYVCICVSVCPGIYVSMYLCVYVSMYLCACETAYLCKCVSMYLFVDLSIYL